MTASVIILVKNFRVILHMQIRLLKWALKLGEEGKQKHILEKIRQFIFIFNKYNYDSKSHNYIQTEHIKFKL